MAFCLLLRTGSQELCNFNTLFFSHYLGWVFFFFLLYVCIKKYLIMVEFTLVATNTYRARMTVVSQISFI